MNANLLFIVCSDARQHERSCLLAVGRVGYQRWEKWAKFSVNGVNLILYGQMCICIT
jgi:hypothetical protein